MTSASPPLAGIRVVWPDEDPMENQPKGWVVTLLVLQAVILGRLSPKTVNRTRTICTATSCRARRRRLIWGARGLQRHSRVALINGRESNESRKGSRKYEVSAGGTPWSGTDQAGMSRSIRGGCTSTARISLGRRIFVAAVKARTTSSHRPHRLRIA
jgi:hypothetical protein